MILIFQCPTNIVFYIFVVDIDIKTTKYQLKLQLLSNIDPKLLKNTNFALIKNCDVHLKVITL